MTPDVAIDDKADRVVRISADTHMRLRVAAAMTGRSMGEVVGELAERYLPPVTAPFEFPAGESQ